MTTADNTTIAPVRRSVSVKANPDKAFRVFTEGMDTWWPRSHHIGRTPMTKSTMQGRVGGRCFSEHDDGSECDFGEILVWEPPHRFVMAWKIDATWQYQPDLSKTSEVEVTFTPEPGGSTRVDLEHRHFERLGEGGAIMRAGVDTPQGWVGILQDFAARAEAE